MSYSPAHSPGINKTLTTVLIIMIIIWPVLHGSGDEIPDENQRAVQYGIYYKNDQGASWGVVMDQRMSNLHYGGPGGVLNFGRRAHRPSYIAEWSFARLQYNYLRPVHKSTIAVNPGAGMRYLHLRKLFTPGGQGFYAGGQVNVSGNMRFAPRLGNSFMYGDFIGELRPQAELGFNRRFLWRDWNIELSLATSLIGYAVRVPEYGTSYALADGGGTSLNGYEKRFLMPYNYAHITTGIFLRERFRGLNNPNWFRVGYIWDYNTMKGSHDLNMSTALHQLVLELYFRVK
jgi:hypothetical protein